MESRAKQAAAFKLGKQIDPGDKGANDFLNGKQVDEKKAGDFLQNSVALGDLLEEQLRYPVDSGEYKILAQKIALLSTNNQDSSVKDFLGYDPNQDPRVKDFLGGF